MQLQQPTTLVTPVAKAIFGLLKEAHNLYGEYRVSQFLRTIDSEIENLSVDRQMEINDFLTQSRTRKILADYAAAITNTSSEIVLRALALLFINDHQFGFSVQEKARFITCVSGLDDIKVNLFIRLSSLPALDLKTVYPIYSIGHHNFDAINLDVAVDEFFAYTEDFFKRGLLLRDPRGDLGSSFYNPEDSDWSICFGISHTLKRYAALLRKAKFLSGE